jgi:catechol 2,3-dioxygenase-like lactoylglutathione lyase family enzyme
MIQSIAFLAYAASNIKTARHFYENILGLKLVRESGAEWFEYDIGDTTFALSTAAAEHPVPVRGSVVAFEGSDLETEVARLRKLGASFRERIPKHRFVASPWSSTRTGTKSLSTNVREKHNPGDSQACKS